MKWRDSRWETTQTPVTNSNNNKFSQFSRDASLVLDGVTVSRETNAITDLIEGATINLKKDVTSDVVLQYPTQNLKLSNLSRYNELSCWISTNIG